MTEPCIVESGQYLLEATRLRRERNELIGQLAVRCRNGTEPRAVNSYLCIADFNFSSLRARSERAKFIQQRAEIKDIDWYAQLELLCQEVFNRERCGEPVIDLSILPVETRKIDDLEVAGIRLPRLEPTVLFGDGGSAKSYIALYWSGLLAQKGVRVLYFDWEMTAQRHLQRLKRLFPTPPMLFYRHCAFPMHLQAEDIGQTIRQNRIDYAVFDSITFACDGRPEDAEIAVIDTGSLRNRERAALMQ